MESFERNLDQAQRDLGIDPTSQVPVYFANETDWLTELFKFFPTILMLGALVFLGRRLSSGASGRGVSLCACTCVLCACVLCTFVLCACVLCACVCACVLCTYICVVGMCVVCICVVCICVHVCCVHVCTYVHVCTHVCKVYNLC